MNLFGTLLKKELIGLKPRKRDILGTAISAITVIGVMAAFVYLFIELHQRFIPLGISDEILSLFICAVFVLSVALSLNKADKIIFSADDREITRPLPLDSRVVVLAKAVALLIYQTISVGAVALPLFIAFGITGGAGVGFYFKAVFCVLILSVAASALSLIISPAFNKIKNFLLAHGPLLFVLSLIFIGLLFFGYKYVLDLIISLIRNRRLQFVFNSKVVGGIRTAAKWLPFSSSLGLFLGAKSIWRALICFVAAVGLFCGGYFLAAKLYLVSSKERAPRAKKAAGKRRSVAGALLFKEINELVRTPGYMFSYLSVALSLPALAYLTMGVLQEVVAQMLTALYIGPFALFVVVLYSTVSNTFAGDAVSREGNKLSIIKTIPVSFKLQIGIKLILALGIAALAISVTVLVLALSGTLTAVESLFIFFIALFSASASVIGMINNDLGGMDAEKNSSMAVIKSLLYSLFVGAASVGITFLLRGAGSYFLIYFAPLVISALYCGIVWVRYHNTMERKIKSL